MMKKLGPFEHYVALCKDGSSLLGNVYGGSERRLSLAFCS